MDMCGYRAIAIRVHRRTIDMITALGGAPPVMEEDTFFMIYCADSDHEDTEIIDKETYHRTYGEMAGHVLACYVTTID